MIIFRLATEKYKNDLSGTGAKLYGGRWNSKDIPALYAAENVSLAVLEIFVRADKLSIPPSYHLIKILLPDALPVQSIKTASLKKGWKDDWEYTQWMGDQFLLSGNAAALKVPSAIVEEEYNYVLNTTHPDCKKLKVVETSIFQFDKRLFVNHE